MFRLSAFGALSLVALLFTFGCDAGAPVQQATATPITPIISPTATSWVPPTALAGTPIPGAEATLTAAPRLKTEQLIITTSQGERIDMTVEIADTPEARQLGLMFRSSLPPNGGMLFDFGEDTTSAFWMQNTILPLSIAFITADGTIIDIKDMQPLDTSTVGASGPYRYALEANQGFFGVHNIAPGDRVTFPGAQAVVIPQMPLCIR